MKDIICVLLGFLLGVLCLFLPELRGDLIIKKEIINGLVATTCLFGCLLSFYLCFRIVRDKRPQVLSSSVVYLVFVLPIFGLAVARYLTTGNVAFLALGVGTLAVLILEGRSLVSVGATVSLVHPKIKRIFENENLPYREIGSDFHLAESEVAVRPSIVGVTVSEVNFSEKSLFPKIKSALPRETAGDIVPLPYLNFRRYFFWGVVLLILVAVTAAERPWWHDLQRAGMSSANGWRAPAGPSSNQNPATPPAKIPHRGSSSNIALF